MLILVADCLGKIIQFPLIHTGDVIKVGSLPESHLCLPYKGVSRNHFTLTFKKPDWILKDPGSTNGTRINGLKVESAEIKPGDLIQAGIVELSVQEVDENKIVKIAEKISDKAHAGTDRLEDAARQISENIFVSEKLIFAHGMIPGNSPKMMELYQRLHSLIDSDVSVLLVGETG